MSLVTVAVFKTMQLISDITPKAFGSSLVKKKKERISVIYLMPCGVNSFQWPSDLFFPVVVNTLSVELHLICDSRKNNNRSFHYFQIHCLPEEMKTVLWMQTSTEEDTRWKGLIQSLLNIIWIFLLNSVSFGSDPKSTVCERMQSGAKKFQYVNFFFYNIFI